MNSRADILGRIRACLGRTPDNEQQASIAMDAYIAARARGPRSKFDDDLLAAFCKKSEALASSIEQVPTPTDVPLAVSRYLAAHGLPRQAVCWPALLSLDWTSAGIEVEARAARGSDLVGITGCDCAVAETGTLVLCSAPEQPAATSLLPETHIAILDAGRVLAGMEDAFDWVRAEIGDLPRAINFISGPSRTGDIEQTIVIGAHGPYRVHIIIVVGGRC